MAPRRVFVVLAVVAAVAIAASAVQTGHAAGRRNCPKPAGRPLRAGEITRALRRLIPKQYGSMTNQSGGGAWRGYEVLGEFTLAWPMRLAQSYYAKAARTCRTQVANHSWVAIINFPRAQSAVYGTSAAYLVRTNHGIVIWRSQFVRP